MAAAAVQIVERPEAAMALLDPVRLRIARALVAPDSATGLARRFSLPRQRVNYHLRVLEGAGLVELEREQRKRNCIERIYRATAHTYLLDPHVLAAVAPTDTSQMPASDRFSWAYLVARCARALRDLARLRRGAADEKKRLATFTVDAAVRIGSPARFRAFMEQVSQAVQQIAVRYDEPGNQGGREFQLFLSCYATPAEDSDTRPDDSAHCAAPDGEQAQD